MATFLITSLANEELCQRVLNVFGDQEVDVSTGGGWQHGSSSPGVVSTVPLSTAMTNGLLCSSTAFTSAISFVFQLRVFSLLYKKEISQLLPLVCTAALSYALLQYFPP